MTEGKVMPLLLAFSVPIFIGNLFQQLYNVVDTVVIGHFLGDEALAAVGSTSAIYSHVHVLCSSRHEGPHQQNEKIEYILFHCIE